VWCEQRNRGEAAVAAVLHEMHRIDRAVSPYLPGGALGTTRPEANWRPAALAPELTQLIETAMQWAQHCQTAFDPQAADRSPQAGLQSTCTPVPERMQWTAAWPCCECAA
jgi:thiamine biosynthesis lipoprotein ApbE